MALLPWWPWTLGGTIWHMSKPCHRDANRWYWRGILTSLLHQEYSKEPSKIVCFWACRMWALTSRNLVTGEKIQVLMILVYCWVHVLFSVVMSCHFCILCLHRKLKIFSRRMWSNRQFHVQCLTARADLLVSRHDVGTFLGARARPLEDGCGGLRRLKIPHILDWSWGTAFLQIYSPLPQVSILQTSLGDILVPLPKCIIMFPYRSLHRSSHILILSCFILFCGAKCQHRGMVLACSSTDFGQRFWSHQQPAGNHAEPFCTGETV